MRAMDNKTTINRFNETAIKLINQSSCPSKKTAVTSLCTTFLLRMPTAVIFICSSYFLRLTDSITPQSLYGT